MDITNTCPAVRVAMFPKDTNGTGRNIFGGVILAHMDIAAGIAASRVCPHRSVTKLFREVNFIAPVRIKDVLTIWAEVTKVGRTSMEIDIVVKAERNGKFIDVTNGKAVFVAVDEQDRPIPIDTPLPDRTAPEPTAAHTCSNCQHVENPAKPHAGNSVSRRFGAWLIQLGKRLSN